MVDIVVRGDVMGIVVIVWYRRGKDDRVEVEVVGELVRIVIDRGREGERRIMRVDK